MIDKNKNNNNNKYGFTFWKDLITLVVLGGTITFSAYMGLRDSDNINNQTLIQIQRDVTEIKRDLPLLKKQLDSNTSSMNRLSDRLERTESDVNRNTQWREQFISDLAKIQMSQQQTGELIEKAAQKIDRISERLTDIQTKSNK